MNDAGIDSIQWSGVGNPNAPDEDICAFARRERLIVVSNDLDFARILSLTRDHARASCCFAGILWFRRSGVTRLSLRLRRVEPSLQAAQS